MSLVKRITFICVTLLVAPTVSSVSTAQNPSCSGTVREGVFSGSITCTSNSCLVTCAENSSGVTPGGVGYSWCQCGSEAESGCCHVILLHVFGADTPAKAGDCGVPGCNPGTCKLSHSYGPGVTTTTAGCWVPALEDPDPL